LLSTIRSPDQHRREIGRLGRANLDKASYHCHWSPALDNRREGRNAMPETYTGTCFCGAVEIQAAGAPLEMGYCHCASCRAYSGAPVTAFVLWKAGSVTVSKGAEHFGHFQKSPMSVRHFCKRCGGHLMTHHPALGLTDVCAAVLPGLAFKPSVHLNYAETVLPMKDGLTKLKDFPAEVGGSGETMAE
jgi:hypothetical protein